MEENNTYMMAMAADLYRHAALLECTAEMLLASAATAKTPLAKARREGKARRMAALAVQAELDADAARAAA